MSKQKWIDQAGIKNDLAKFFEQKSNDISNFGGTVNQTFEAFVFAATVAWFKEQGWKVTIHHPAKHDAKLGMKLKFSTRGKPSGYSYAECEKGKRTLQIRHGLRIATAAYTPSQKKPANICVDVAVIENTDLGKFASDDFVTNNKLVTFGEAKHMSAFAELVANFVGLVHELQPDRLKAKRPHKNRLSPFLYVSGFLQNTALGIKESIENRQYDLQIYWRTSNLAKACSLPERDPPALSKTQKKKTSKKTKQARRRKTKR